MEPGLPAKDILKTASGGVCSKILSLIITFITMLGKYTNLVKEQILSLIITFTTMLGKFKNLVEHTVRSEETETVSGSGNSSEKPTTLMQEMSKQIYQVGVNAIFGLVAMKRDKLEPVEQLIIVAIAMGCSLIYNGLLLRETTPRVAMIAEPVGVGIVFVAIHLLVSKYLLWWLQIFPAVCCAVSITPLVMAVVARKMKGKRNSDINDNGVATQLSNL